MNISFENPDKVNGLLTLTIEKDDYQADVEKALKDYRKRANIPGFRPGQVPMSMIKRQFGTSVKVDVINRMLGEKIYAYISENTHSSSGGYNSIRLFVFTIIFIKFPFLKGHIRSISWSTIAD